MKILHLLPISVLSGIVHARNYCPHTTGPLVPPPVIKRDCLDLSRFNSYLQSLDGDNSFAKWNTSSTSFSVHITSTRDNNTIPFFTHHHTADIRDPKGTARVDGNTVYRAASITKLVTVLAVLMTDGMDFSQPIAKYLPELKGQSDWDHITLGMLAAHKAGVPGDGPTFDRASQGVDLTKLGFPPLEASEYPECSVNFTTRHCTRKEFFSTLLDDGFTAPPGHDPAYSNQGIILLGRALESIHKAPYESIINTLILSPLGMRHSGFTAPPAKTAILPTGAHTFTFALGPLNPTGGLYTTPSDLTLLLSSIANSQLLPEATTEAWLAPHSFLASLTDAIGAPWEIYRASISPSRPPVTLYTKSGDLPGYAGQAVLIPEFGLSVVVVAAGGTAVGAATDLLERVVEMVVPAVADGARRQAEEAFVGTFEGPDGARMEVVGDAGPGLRVGVWRNRGVDMLESFKALKGDEGLEVRIYPVAGSRERWRVVFDVQPREGAVIGRCPAWAAVDRFRYGTKAVDEIVFGMRGGRAVGLKNEGLRVRMKRV